MASAKEGCPIDCLTDDALLLVFSFLNIKDKCFIARVCRRFNKVVQDGCLWKYIDLTQIVGKKYDQIKVFLQKYACQSTRFMRLGFVDNAILQIMHQKCPLLQQLSLSLEPASVFDLSLLPSELIWLSVRFNMSTSDFTAPMLLRHGIQMERFGETPLGLLQYLCLKSALVDDVLCEKLAASQELRQIRFEQCSFVATIELQQDILGKVEMLEISDCRFTSNVAFDHTFEVVGQNSKLTGLELSDPSFVESVPVGSVALDHVFRAISEHCSLRMLSVNAPGFCTISGETLAAFLQSTHDLEVLSLVYNQDVDDQVLSLIPGETTNLKVLNLYGNRRITDVGIQSLCEHPTLMALSVGACFKLQPLTILQIAATIPNLLLLGMSKPRQEINATEFAQFKIQHPHVKIEYSYDLWVAQVETITQSLCAYEMKYFVD